MANGIKRNCKNCAMCHKIRDVKPYQFRAYCNECGCWVDWRSDWSCKSFIEDEMDDVSDWAREDAKKIIEPSEKIKEKNRNIFKPKPIFVSTPKKGGIDWGEIADLQSFNAEIVNKSDVPKFASDKYEEKIFRLALKFRTREVWVVQKLDVDPFRMDFLLYPSRMDIVGCEQICYNFDRIIFMKRSEFRKLPKTRNFSLVLKYRKTMRKMLGVK